jgi:polyisoprenoid-binding protein YceI
MGTLPLQAATRRFQVDQEKSRVVVHVGRAGLLSFAGHEHEVLALRFSGEVTVDPETLGASSVQLRFEAGGLGVSERGEPPGDAAKVQARMLGPDVLDVLRFPAILFEGAGPSGRQAGPPGVWELELAGQLRVRNVVRSLRLPVRVELEQDRMTARGQVELRQSDFGIRPVSVAGVVKVEDRLRVDYIIVASAVP